MKIKNYQSNICIYINHCNNITMICGCFLTLRKGIPCKFAQRRKCVTKILNPGKDNVQFFEFFVQTMDAKDVYITMSSNATYEFMSNLFKHRARGYSLGHDLSGGNITPKMIEAKMHLSHIEHLYTSYKQNIQPRQDALQWWKDMLMNVHFIDRVSGATKNTMTTYYEEHLADLSYKIQDTKLQQFPQYNEQNAKLQTQLTQLQKEIKHKEKMHNESVAHMYSKYEKLQYEHAALFRQEQIRANIFSELNERIIMVRSCYQHFVNLSDIQKKIIEYAQIQDDPEIYLKNLLKIYQLSHILESLYDERLKSYMSIKKMIAPVSFTCHMCEEIVPYNNGSMSVPEICKQININGICMMCYYARRYRILPAPNYIMPQQKFSNELVLALFDGLFLPNISQNIDTANEFKTFSNRLISHVSTPFNFEQTIRMTLNYVIKYMSGHAPINIQHLKSCYEAELKHLADDIKDDDKKEACSNCCRERICDEPDTLLRHSPFVVPCVKCPMLKCCIECFSNLEVKRITRNKRDVMEQINADRATRFMGPISFVAPHTVSLCLNNQTNCDVAKNWRNYLGLIGGINIVEMQHTPFIHETVYDELVNNNPSLLFDSDIE